MRNPCMKMMLAAALVLAPLGGPCLAGPLETVPFSIETQHIVIDVTLNDSITLRMMLDTGFGSRGAIVFDPGVGRTLGLRYFRDISLGGGGTSGARSVSLATGAKLSVGGLEFPGQPLMVMKDGRLKDRWPAEGIIGATLFGRIVEIDYDGRTLSFYDRYGDLPYRQWEEFEIGFRAGTPWTKASVVMEDGLEVELDLLVDTGGGPLMLYPWSRQDISLPQMTISGDGDLLGEGLTGPFRGVEGRIAALRLGPFELEGIHTVFPFEESMANAGSLGCQGLIGHDVLRRFRVAFDYPRGMLYLAPGSRFGEPFERNMAGLGLFTLNDGTWRVVSVIRGSPAHSSGIREGDIVVAIDGKGWREYDEEALDSMMCEEGRTIRVAVRDGSATRTHSLVLRKLI